MSKQNTARSRAEKNRTAANAILAPISNDIVPGKYNDYDWNITLERENSEEYINVLVEELLKIVEQNIHEKYLNLRIIPFTVELAKNAMVKIIEWDFLQHDSGEGDRLESVWLEDDEPESSKIDSWAQGYFPKRQASCIYSQSQAEIREGLDDEMSFGKLEESEEEIEESPSRFVDDVGESEISSPYDKEREDYMTYEPRYESDIDPECEIIDEECATVSVSKDKKRVFKPYKGKIKYNDLEMLTETLYETELRFELEKRKREARLNRSTSSQLTTSRQVDVVDYEKKVIQKLFQTSIKDYQQLRTNDILQNANDQLVSLMKIPSDQLVSQRVRANHKMLEVGLIRKNLSSAKGDGSVPERVVSKIMNVDEKKVPMVHGDKHPLPISMLDSIDPVPGVVVQEGDRVKKSVNKKLDRVKQMEKEFLKLRPIRTQSIQASYLIEDIINVNHIQVKPLATSTPIPAISSGFSRLD